MGLNRQEKYIKQKMQSFEPHVDTGKLWASLEDYVPKKKRRRKTVFWILLIFFISISAFMGWLIYNGGKDVKKPSTADVRPAFANKSDNQTKSGFNHGQQTASPDKDAPANINKTKESKYLSARHKSGVSKQWKGKNTNSNTGGKKLRSNKNKIIAYNPETSDFKNAKESGNTAISGENGNIIEPFAKIRMLTPVFSHSATDNIHTPGVYQIEKSRHARFFAPEVATGAGYTLYSASSMGGTGDYSKVLNEIVNSEPALSVYTGVVYNMGKKVYLRTGLQFERYVLRLHSRWQETIEEYVPKENGLVQRVKKISDYSATGYRYYYTVNIPFEAGYKFFEKPHYDIFLESGLTVNLHTFVNGAVLKPDGKLSFHKDGRIPGYDNFGIGLQSYFGIDYKLNSKYVIYLKTGIAYNEIKFDNGDNRIKESLMNFKVYSGIRF